jgi:peroxiredoxin
LIKHRTPRVGDIAPPFTLPTQRGVLVSLSETLQHSPGGVTVAFVGRVTLGGRDTPTERRIRTLRNEHPRILEQGLTLLVIVANRQDDAKRYVEEAGTPFHLLCDEDGAVARQYGLGLGLGRWTLLLRRDIRPARFGVDPNGRVGFCQTGEWAR